MSAMKNWNRWLLLGLVALAGLAPAVKAQSTVGVRIGLSEQYAQFLVDGQLYSNTQVFSWAEGTQHVIQFPYSHSPIGEPESFQYMRDGQRRFRFTGWVATTTLPLALSGGPISTFTAVKGLTEIVGNVSVEIPFEVVFQDTVDTVGCEPAKDGGNPARPGLVFIDNTCFSNSAKIWITPDAPHDFRIYTFPGWAFEEGFIGDYKETLPPAFTRVFPHGSSFRPLFKKAKRVRFSTVPRDLQVVVDGALITPKGLVKQRFDPTPVSSEECGEFQALPVEVPSGIPSLCVGDFDFIPGSVHRIGAPDPQTDTNQVRWVFDRFSNGQGQNSVFTTPWTTDVADEIAAVFTVGIKGIVQPNVTGLRLIVDGRDDWPQPFYGAWWGAGHIHRIEAPERQRDASGRMWKFVKWSDGGARVHEVSAPAGVEHFILTADYELLGQVNITSTVPGLTIKANGVDCTTPCVLDEPAGTALVFTAPQNIALGEGSRYQFESWLGKSFSPSQELTFTQDRVSFKANYQAAHRLLAYSDPDNGATFKYAPESTDGFFREGTEVHVTVQTKTGFKFLAWSGDLSSTSKEEVLTMYGPSEIVAHLEKVPQIAPAGIRNAAGGGPDGTVAPGSIISIYGENLTSELKIGPSNPLAQAIGDVYVTVNGGILPLIFVSPSQINAQLLSTIGEGEHTLTVHTTGQKDVTGKFTVKKNAPGVFFNLTSSGMPLAAALHQDLTPITQDSPARKGEIVTLYGTGLGAYTQPWIDGFILPTDFLFYLADPVKVLAAPPAPVPADPNAPPPAPPVIRDPVFAGGAPGMVGANVVQLKIDNDLPAGSVLEFYLSVNGRESNHVQLPIQ